MVNAARVEALEEKASISKAKDHARVARRRSLMRYMNARRVSRTKSSGGIASRICLRDLIEIGEDRRSLLRSTGHSPRHGGEVWEVAVSSP